jgi:hypothetical protein
VPTRSTQGFRARPHRVCPGPTTDPPANRRIKGRPSNTRFRVSGLASLPSPSNGPRGKINLRFLISDLSIMPHHRILPRIVPRSSEDVLAVEWTRRNAKSGRPAQIPMTRISRRCLEIGFWTLEFLWGLVFGFWCLYSLHWTLRIDHWTFRRFPRADP